VTDGHDDANPVAARGKEHGVGRGTPDMVVARRIFLFVGNAVGTMSLIYLLTEDDAGQMLLGVTSLLGLVCGGFLWLGLRDSRAPSPDARHAGPEPAPYLPHASVWPFAIGVAAFLITNGLILGIWFLVPGALLLFIAVIGFGRQSRHRD
jgi:hypothetical protein